MKRLLALDQSSKTTGYAVYHDDRLYTFGHFTCNQKDIGERLMNIRYKVIELIDQYDINEVIMEDIHLEEDVNNNVQTFKKLAEVFGVIYEMLTEKDISNNAVQASVWKSGVGIASRQRAAQKRDAQKLVHEKFNVNPTEDEADAVCIGLYWTSQKNICQNNFDWS